MVTVLDPPPLHSRATSTDAQLLFRGCQVTQTPETATHMSSIDYDLRSSWNCSDRSTRGARPARHMETIQFSVIA